MFFIMGINPVKKPIKYNNTFICNICGKYGNYEVYTTYMCFSLFFIPLIKWKKHYYAYSTCCGSLYEINREIGRNLQRGVELEIMERDLTLLDRTSQYSSEHKSNIVTCKHCSYELKEDYTYCPNCGNRL